MYGNFFLASGVSVKPISLFVLANARGMTVSLINYGARIAGIEIPTSGGSREIVLGFDDLSGYESDTASHGATVGRYANRIKNASFTLGGKIFKLTQNDGSNFLHGSFAHRVFDAETTRNGVIFTYRSPDGEDGFPGNLEARVSYTLDGDRLTIEWSATTDAETVVNMTNHAYFDLSGGKDLDIGGHVLQINSSKFLESGEDLCPTGKFLPVEGTPFDFTKPKQIGRDIDKKDRQLKVGGGYDHCFVIDGYDGKGKNLRHATTATAPDASISMKIFTTQPGIQLYTGNALDGTGFGRGRVHTRRSAFCLETQHYPDSPNHPEFPTTTLKPGEEYRETTVFEFGY